MRILASVRQRGCISRKNLHVAAVLSEVKNSYEPECFKNPHISWERKYVPERQCLFAEQAQLGLDKNKDDRLTYIKHSAATVGYRPFPR